MSLLRFSALLLEFSVEVIPLFLLAVFIASALEEFLSTAVIERFVGSDNPVSVATASTIGALVPLCTCGMIPLAASLKRKKAHWIPLLAFLTAGVASSIPALVLTLILGLKITILRLVSALIFGFVVAYAAGYIIQRTVEEADVAKRDVHAVCPESEICELCEHRTRKRLFSVPRWREVMEDFWLTVKDFAPWLVFSIVAAALISAAVSQSFIEAILGNKNIFSPFIGALIGLPFYLCAGADVPLAKALLDKGASLGTIIAIMSAAPTVNIPAAGLLSRWLGRKATFIYLGICWLAAALIGVAVNLIF